MQEIDNGVLPWETRLDHNVAVLEWFLELRIFLVALDM